MGYLLLQQAPQATRSGPANSPKLAVTVDSATALTKLHELAKHSHFEQAHELFESSASLQQNKVAWRIMVRTFCRMGDYTSARAMIDQSADRIGRTGLLQFMVYCFRSSQNSDHLWDAFNIANREYPRDPRLSAAAWFGMLVLQSPRAADVWRASQGLLDSVPFLQARVFHAYIEEQPHLALQFGRQVKARLAETSDNFFSLLPYRWAVRHFGELGNVAAIEEIQSHMLDLDIPATVSLSNDVLQTLPRLHPRVPLTQWLEQLKGWNWPLNSSSLVRLGQILVERYPDRAGVLERGLPTRGPLSPEAEFVHAVEASAGRKSPLEVLSAMHRRGKVPSYEMYVAAFTLLAKQSLKADLAILTERMAAIGYPKHCAGTDLAMLELAGREAPEHQRPLLLQAVQQYLAEYPLWQHDMRHLCRLSQLYMLCNQPETAAHVVDFLRRQENGQYTDANHNSCSLELLLVAENAAGNSVFRIVEDILAARPRISLDRRFRNRMRQLLPKEGENLARRVRVHNDWVLSSLKTEIAALQDLCK